jgi:hypothetical protein
MKPHQKLEPEPVVFWVMGILSIVLGVVSGLLSYASYRHPGGHDLRSAVIFAGYFVLVGIGLLFQRRVAAVLFSLPLLAGALWLGIGSIFAVPFPWSLLNVAFAFIMLLPSWATWRGWSALR